MRRARQASELGYHDYIDLTGADRPHESAECLPAGLRASHAMINELLEQPIPGLGVLSEGLKLAFRRLLQRPAAVECRPRASTDGGKGTHAGPETTRGKQTESRLFGRLS